MTTHTQTDGWGRGRLLGVLAAAALAAVLLVGGLGLFALHVLTADPTDPATAQDDAAGGVVVVDEAFLPADGPGRREHLAGARMLPVDDPRAYRQGQVSATVVEPVVVPAATRTGPAGVETGYPRTPEGALGQLAAIDVAVVAGMSVPATHEIHRTWSVGGTDPAGWVMTHNVTTFLTAAGQGGQVKETGLVVTATPAAGQVKGSDGDDWVVACVLLDVSATLVEPARVAYGHCEAMTWQEDRWVIEATSPVAPAPSTWPGTDLAARAGWRPWVVAGSTGSSTAPVGDPPPGTAGTEGE